MYTIGLDSGSTTTKGVLFSGEELIDKYLIPTAGNPKKRCRRLLIILNETMN